VPVETTPIEQVVTEPSPASVADSKPNEPSESSVVADGTRIVTAPPVAAEPKFSEPVAMVQEPSLDTAIKAREQVDEPLRRTEPTPNEPLVQTPPSETTAKTTEEQLTESPVTLKQSPVNLLRLQWKPPTQNQSLLNRLSQNSKRKIIPNKMLGREKVTGL
jgi:hypothetical protein